MADPTDGAGGGAAGAGRAATLGIGALAARSGVPPSPAAIRRAAFVVLAQRLGLTLDEIAAERARLPDDRVSGRADRARLAVVARVLPYLPTHA
jgi:hypothetical protein